GRDVLGGVRRHLTTYVGRAGQPVRARVRGDRSARGRGMTLVAATRFGAPLTDGGTIGVAAPSGPYYNRSDVLRPVEWWESRGYRVKLTDSVWAQDDYTAGDAKTRANDLT